MKLEPHQFFAETFGMFQIKFGTIRELVFVAIKFLVGHISVETTGSQNAEPKFPVQYQAQLFIHVSAPLTAL